jgi:hypothetical protein
VTYDAPLAVGVSEVSANKPAYAPNEDMRIRASIVNVGDAAATLSATLTIEDLMGTVMCRRDGAPFTVAAGGTYEWEAVCGGVSQEGAYRARVTLWQNGSPVGGGAASIAVRGGEITALTGPALAQPEQPAQFHVTYANYRDQSASAQFMLSIQDAEGGLVQELPPRTLTVPSGGSQTADFTWTPGDEHASRGFQAVARVTVQGQTVGPRMLPFAVSGREARIYLPIVLKNVR